LEELEEKAQTVLVSQTPIAASGGPAVPCAVDGCLHSAAVACDVRLTHMRLNPDEAMHRVPLCQTHEKGFQLLRWQWRRTPNASSTQLILDGVFAPDVAEDR
jgi:hypothetical protein